VLDRGSLGDLRRWRERWRPRLPQDSISQTITPAHMQAFEAGSDNVVEAVFADPTLKGRLVSCDLATGNKCIRCSSGFKSVLPPVQ